MKYLLKNWIYWKGRKRESIDWIQRKSDADSRSNSSSENKTHVELETFPKCHSRFGQKESKQKKENHILMTQINVKLIWNKFFFCLRTQRRHAIHRAQSSLLVSIFETIFSLSSHFLRNTFPNQILLEYEYEYLLTRGHSRRRHIRFKMKGNQQLQYHDTHKDRNINVEWKYRNRKKCRCLCCPCGRKACWSNGKQLNHNSHVTHASNGDSSGKWKNK